MLLPSRTKYRRVHRLPYEGHSKGNTKLDKGDFGLVAKEGAWIPHMPITKKPVGTRQGKGKGNVEAWVAVVKEGKILFEIADVDEATAREALRLAAHKLPIQTKFITRESENGGEKNEG